jgi:DNA gyrase subunit A
MMAMNEDVETRKKLEIGHEIKENMVAYAESVILDRAIPHAWDGMKPVHRRIVYVMGELNLSPLAKTLKCARIVGETLGKFHPHGDSSVYGALVRLAQDFSMRVPLVDGQGNFGSVDGDGAAAMRYTEARLSPFGSLMLEDIDEDTVDFADNFDGTLKEPTVLPTRFPNLLVNGASGIAVGMSTDILPHNLNEACNAVIYLASKWNKLDAVTVDELMRFIPGPDLPTGGLIYRYRRDEKENTAVDMIRQAYETGYAPMVCQAKADIEKNGKNRIIVTEIPYMVTKGSILERIARLGKDGKFTGIISDVNDESDAEGMRIVFDVARGCDPQEALTALFNMTNLRVSLSSNQLALNVDDDGNMYPEVLSLKGMLAAFIKHRLNVITRRTTFQKNRAEKRLHIVEALVKAQANIDKVIKIIKNSENRDTARVELMTALKVDDIQAVAILTTQLQNITHLEANKLQNEKQELINKISELKALLDSKEKRLAVVIAETKEINEKYHTPRKTVIIDNENGHKETVTVADMLIPEKPQMVMVTTNGVQRVDADSFKDAVQVGKASARAVETVLNRLVVEPKDFVVMVSNTGRLWFGNAGRISADMGLGPKENVISLAKLEETATLTMGTRYGNIKRIKMSDVKAARNEGTWGAIIGLEGGSHDEVLFASLAHENANVMFLTQGSTEKGIDPRALRFEANAVNTVVSANAKGVAGISMQDGDPILNAVCFEETNKDGFVIVLTDKGFAKKMRLAEFPTQGRAGKGVITMKLNPKIGLPVAYALANESDALDLLSLKGKRLRILVKDIPDLPRAKNAINIATKFEGLFGDEPVSSIIVVELPAEAGTRKSRSKESPAAVPEPAAEKPLAGKRSQKAAEQPSLLSEEFESVKKLAETKKPIATKKPGDAGQQKKDPKAGRAK